MVATKYLFFLLPLSYIYYPIYSSSFLLLFENYLLFESSTIFIYEVLEELNPALKEMLPHLFTVTYTSDTKAGELTAEWADRLGLPQGIAVAVGALDAHMGAVGASVAPGVLTRIMGTSTCDIMVAGKSEVGDRCIEGICGQVDGSVLPGFIGFEAGQSAFGDIYAWFKKMLAWTLKDIHKGEVRQKALDSMLVELTREAQGMEPSANGVVALDWMNGRRTPYADQNVKVLSQDSHWVPAPRKSSVHWWKPPPSVPAVLWSI